MIKLEQLDIQNFFSHNDTKFNIGDLTGLIMIDGENVGGKYDSNGAGKSTLLESIVYNLSGETLRRVGVNGMINRTNKKNTVVTSKLSIDGESVEISRHRKHDKHGDAILVKKGTNDLTKRLNKETQAVIDNMLGISYRVLTNTIFLGEGLSAKFTQLSDGDKKTLIESTMNLDHDFNKSRDEANRLLKETVVNQGTIKGQIASLEGVLRDLDVEALTASVQNLEPAIERARAESAKQNQIYTTLYESYEGLNQRKLEVTSSLTNLQSLKREQAQVMSHVDDLKKLWASAGQSEECIVCKQKTTDPTSIHNAQSHYMEQLTEQGRKLEGVILQINGYTPEDELKATQTHLDSELTRITAELHEVRGLASAEDSKISTYQNQLQNATNLLQNADKYQEDVNRLTEELKELSRLEEVYNYWYKAFSPQGLLIRVLEDAVKYLNSRIEIYSEMLLDRSYRLELSGTKLSLVDDDNASYETLSSGEKRRLDVAIQFGLHDYVHTYCGLQVDTLFIDEIMDSLDSIGISNIIDVLRIKLSYCNLARIFVITHNADLKSYFDRVLLVTKQEDGFSKLSVV